MSNIQIPEELRHQHLLLRVLVCAYRGDKARYQCSCGHDGPWCRTWYSRDTGRMHEMCTEAREQHEVHLCLLTQGKGP